MRGAIPPLSIRLHGMVHSYKHSDNFVFTFTFTLFQYSGFYAGDKKSCKLMVASNVVIWIRVSLVDLDATFEPATGGYF
jgi:hypothetical protein